MKQLAEMMGTHVFFGTHVVISSKLCSWKKTLDWIGADSLYVEIAPISLEAFAKKKNLFAHSKK
jgi:hypothetical protein